MPKNIWSILLMVLFAVIGVQALRGLWLHPPFDFAGFYLAGKLAATGQISHLYDVAAYQPLMPKFFADGGQHTRTGIFYFIRPAFEAFYYVPLSILPYRTAGLLDGIVNFVVLALLIWKLPIWFNIGEHLRSWIRLGLLLFYPFHWSIYLGQDTLWLTLLIAYAFRKGSEQKQTAAGFVLAFATYKPHLLWLVPFVMVGEKRWRMLSSFALTTAVLMAVSFLAIGLKGLYSWGALLTDPSSDLTPPNMGNLRALALHVGNPLGISAFCLVVASLIVVFWKGDLAQRLTVALLTGVLLSPHAYWQDYALAGLAATLTPGLIVPLLVLLPWPFFYARLDELPMIALAIGWITATAVWAYRYPKGKTDTMMSKLLSEISYQN